MPSYPSSAPMPTPPPVRRRVTGLFILALLLLGLGLGIPRVIALLGQVRQREMAAEMAVLRAAFARGVPLPAESGAATTPAYLDLLVRDGTLQPGEKTFFREWVFANAGAGDPPGTVLLATRSYYEYTVRHRLDARGFAFVRLDGVASSTKLPPPEGSVALPPRAPALLPPE